MPFPFSPQQIVADRGVQTFDDGGNPFVTTAPLRAIRGPSFPAFADPQQAASERAVGAAAFGDPGAPAPTRPPGVQAFQDQGFAAPTRPTGTQAFQTPPNPFQVVGSPSSTGFSIGGRSFSRLAPSARFDNVAQHAIVLEDTPVGADSRLVFESFPGEWEESYKVKPYRVMGQHRMPQPQFATYQGGDWGPFPLTLVFRAGINDGSEGDPNAISPRGIESILITMERKVNWLIALAFPLERQNVEAERIIKQQVAAGFLDPSLVSEDTISNLKRNDPPFVLLILGTWKVIRGYLQGISWTWKPPFHPVSGRPYGAEVRMQFQPIQPAYPTWNSIRNQAGTAGVSGPITDRLPQADRQRIVVTNNLLQNQAAFLNGFQPTSLTPDPEPSDGTRPGGGTVPPGGGPFGAAGTGASPF